MTTELAREALRRVALGRASAVTIGVFDGVHRGHQQMIGQMLEFARKGRLASVAVTFYPHPRLVLQPQAPLTYLCGMEERIERLKSLGIDAVALVPFTTRLSHTSAREFTSMLVEELEMRLLMVGADFVLGRGREGTADVLAKLGREMGFAFHGVPLLMDENGQKVGSSAIHTALQRGDMVTAAAQLGRPFSLQGIVVRGAERGRTIGFPTANIDVGADQALPAFGVYVTKAYLESGCHQAVTNIGIRPTFSETRPTVETYILDFQGDLYGKEIQIELIDRLREERRFGGVEELMAQISIDIEATRRAFA